MSVRHSNTKYRFDEPLTKICEWCGQEYKSHWLTTQYCSGKCGSAATRIPKATIECSKCGKVVLKREAFRSHNTLFCSLDCKSRSKTCPICTTEHCRKSTYCSQACHLTSNPVGYDKLKANSIERSRQKQALLILLLIERDGDLCHICGEPVVMDAVDWHERPSVDHVIPLTKGGANAPDNVRLAHCGCNTAKGNRAA